MLRRRKHSCVFAKSVTDYKSFYTIFDCCTYVYHLDMTSSAQASVSQEFAETMASAPLLTSQLSQPASVADSGVHSGSEDSAPFAKDDVDSVKEIAGGLSSSSDEEPTPPPRVKFTTEKCKPAPSPLSNAASGHRSRSPRRAASKPARLRDRSCDRCADRNFGSHKKGCARADVFRSFVSCPRCQAAIVCKTGWRPHARSCYKQLPAGAESPCMKWKQLVQRCSEPITLLTCNMCSTWQTHNDLLRDLHSILCAPDPKRIPSLPPLQDIQRADDEAMAFPQYFVDQIAFAFTLSPALQTSRVGYIYRYVTKRQLNLPRDHNGDTPAPRACSGDPAALSIAKLPPLPSRPRRPSPPAPKLKLNRQRNPSTNRIRGRRSDTDLPSRLDTVAPMSTVGGHLSQSATCPRGKLNYEARRRCVPPTAIIERGRERIPVAVELNQRAVSQGDEPRWCEPADLPHPSPPVSAPASPATNAATTHHADRDRFKIQRPDGRWTDAYGRSTSPIAIAKREFIKPACNLVGVTEARLKFHIPASVRVAGHLPAGWGSFVLPSAVATCDAFVITPGHRTAPPTRAMDMDYAVKFYFTDDMAAPAGTLLTNVPLHEHSKLQFRSSGVTTVFTIESVATLKQAGGGGLHM